jgi:hypothetical protein
MGMDGLFEGLAQQELPALRCRDVAAVTASDVVGGLSESAVTETRVTLTMRRSSSSQAVRVFPQRDVARHVHFLRHQWLAQLANVFSQAAALEQHQLVDVSHPLMMRLATLMQRRATDGVAAVVRDTVSIGAAVIENTGLRRRQGDSTETDRL